MKKIVVLISGGGSNLEAIAKACQTGNIPASIELVISNQDHVKGLERAKKFHLMSKVIEAGIFPVWQALAMASRFEPPPEIRTTIFFIIIGIESAL